ncbi:YraN family protein [Bifidobacterium psychraerophilum]|jgi:putative endonuclease|uniref:YraN family protein n=1 Tax=Bifidobacterium psychraerophilum TaxID=218140 RepID=UPI0023F4CC61|nr:YraN family protein [Bifidobacterium psychraerophilum]MCI1660670.1 YraN family protein [Bifidobacterium psychraerophilum]MCI1804573.1 YraN family protein [Bifidobacterium psychraerophilum]MCI2177100.1 YraN family protein [Bifidobacterium psychraerophilum]MCI2181640.1 YraN family protein [Bifidobacterium psychraerophilum]
MTQHHINSLHGYADHQRTIASIRSLLLDPGISAKRVGALGETYAAAWLASRGWTILDRNWGTRYGELDIVGADPEGILVFVEVKTRRSTTFGHAQEAVDSRKQAHLRSVAAQWMIAPEHRRSRAGIRFDVVTLTLTDGGLSLRHIPGAF